LEPLLASLVVLLVALLAITDRRSRRRIAALEELARTDALTGLPNRRGWREQLDRELARASRSDDAVSVGLVDLDCFKGFNDEHGHQAGDRLLCELAKHSADRLRATDIFARYGGEEFALVLPSASIDYALEIVERVRAAVPGDQTCSAGIACWDKSETAEELMARADAALYEAKRRGRDMSVVAGGRPSGRFTPSDGRTRSSSPAAARLQQ
jgi:diguanylate cyclase (GGDEF)-like protein